MGYFGVCVLAAAVLAVPAPVVAGQLADVLFRPGAFAATTGQTRYSHMRSGPDIAGLRLVTAGELLVTPHVSPNGLQLGLTHRVDGKDVPVSVFPAAGGDPVLLWFLENTVRSMALITQGSPFYIRNRLREALIAADLDRAEGPVTAELRPFANDARRGQMGAFAGMVLAVTVDPAQAVPLLALSADTTGAGGSYRETLTLESR